jgi:hypothetical protein
MGRNVKFQVQDSFLECFFFWKFGDLKNESHFLKKATFSTTISKWNFKFWITVPFQSGWAHLLRIQQGFARPGPNLAGAPNDQWHLE